MGKEYSNFLHIINSRRDYSVLASEEEDDKLQPRGRAHPISRAAWFGHVDVVRLLIECGVNPEYQNAAGDRPLCLAAEAGHFEVVRLLDMGASPNRISTFWGRLFPLTRAAAKGYEGACRVLLEYLEENHRQKAELQIQEALAAAAQEGKHRIIELLLDWGADINCQVGGSPLTQAVRQCRLDTVES